VGGSPGGETLRQIVERILARQPRAQTDNAVLVLEGWLADPEYPLPDAVRRAVELVRDYALTHGLRSPESFRRERQKITEEGG